jgi:hypothetical protein
MSAEPTGQLSDAPLQFDRAVHAEPSSSSRPTCAQCTKVITDAYFHDGDQTLCTDCGKVRQEMAVPDRAARTFIRAGVFGGGAALLGALLYYGVMAFLELEIGIVAIAIGWFVGRAVAKATRGRSGRRHQVLALSLTYLSVALAYAPIALKGVKSGAEEAKIAADSVAKATRAPAPTAALADSTPAVAGRSTAARTSGDDAPTAGGVLLAFVVLGGFVLVLPIIAAVGSMPSGILSILIIGFGLRQAWRISLASNAVITGPHAIGAAAV